MLSTASFIDILDAYNLCSMWSQNYVSTLPSHVRQMMAIGMKWRHKERESAIDKRKWEGQVSAIEGMKEGWWIAIVKILALM